MQTKLVNIVIPPLPKELTYALSEDLADRIQIGHQVEIPLAKRLTQGFVVEFLRQESNLETPFKIKPVAGLKKDYRFFLPEQLNFFRWVADYYCQSLSQVIETAIPPIAAQKFKRTIFLAQSPGQPPRGSLERRLLELITAAGKPLDYSAIVKKFRAAGPVLHRMQKKGTIQIHTQEILDRYRFERPTPDWVKREVDLNEAQTQAFKAVSSAIEKKEFQCFLLHGVTGSGKTEIYIEAMRYAMQAGLGALIIVPEIALTPQLIDRFLGRLSSNIAVLHSALKRGTRWDAWRALIEGQTNLALGARSAIFAPVRRLGLIIVDEEHDSSYKQEEGLRYNARDLAVARARLENCPVVLGSATPALESFHHALTKKYHYLSLPLRPENMATIDIHLEDLNLTKPADMPSKNISPKLFQAISDVLNRHEQAFILFNRRGFASYLQCDTCEKVLDCPNCSVALTYHSSSHSLLCHYCNLSQAPPEFCPHCQEIRAKSGPFPTDNPLASKKPPGRLIKRGAGTEKVFAELRNLFPGATIDRLDRDAVSNAESYRCILEKVRNRKTDILVGTQMIAKGHDLPGVTLVGIIDCDVGLHMPDFRAGERVFQLLTQASGRAGRGDRPGMVILQTHVPNHPSLIHTVTRDYRSFAQHELGARQALDYPPFSRMLRIIASAADKLLPKAVLESMRCALLELNTRENLQLKLLGPAPAPLEKLKTEWRWHILVKSKTSRAIRKAVHTLQPAAQKSRKVKIVFDIDPQDMM